MDFYEKEVYVGLWDNEEHCSKSFTVPAKSAGERIPLFVVPFANGDFVAGQEGIVWSRNNDCEGATALYGKHIFEQLMVNGNLYDVTDLLAGFLGDVLSAVSKCFGGASVARICITGERMNPEDERRLSVALMKIGFERENFFIINHANAFLRYMISTDEIRRRQWAVDIDMGTRGSEAYAYNPADRSHGFPAYVEHSEETPLMQVTIENIPEITAKAEAFDNLVAQVLIQNKNATFLYVTGRAAEDECIKEVMRKYASPSLKIFSGKNLYFSGACYRAQDERPRDMMLEDGDVFHTVSVSVYRDAVIDPIPLVNAGCPLDKAKGKIYLIPDNTNKVVFTIKDLRTGRTETVIFPLEDLVNRENKTNRLEVTASFPDIKTLVIKVRDLGFGDIYPATYRVCEQTLKL